MLMYTSGTTGKPKGTVHTHCGILAKNALDMGLCIDLKTTDQLLWMSDMGWIVGPKIVVSATLLGATLVIAEGTPDWPINSRMWRVAADNKVTILGIVPTMVRQMMRHGPEISRSMTYPPCAARFQSVSHGRPMPGFGSSTTSANDVSLS